jgi:3-oxoacyl-[acyl-carrier protein] reductase
MDLQLKDTVAVVMAASKGLGAATARAFVEEGAHVVISGRDAEALNRAAAEIGRGASVRVVPVVADSSKADDIQRLVQEAVREFGRIDALVVNAGGPAAGRFVEFDDAAWQSAIDLTLMSAIRAARAVIPVMQAQKGGSITFITSVSVKHTIDNLVFSNSLRLAVAGMAKTLARELGPDNIRVNLIGPGYTATDRILALAEANATRNKTTVAAELAKTGAQTALGRVATLEEFAKPCVFLASPAAGFITGAVLIVDGGQSRSI